MLRIRVVGFYLINLKLQINFYKVEIVGERMNCGTRLSWNVYKYSIIFDDFVKLKFIVMYKTITNLHKCYAW